MHISNLGLQLLLLSRETAMVRHLRCVLGGGGADLEWWLKAEIGWGLTSEQSRVITREQKRRLQRGAHASSSQFWKV
jgi:hypothetical protein